MPRPRITGPPKGKQPPPASDASRRADDASSHSAGTQRSSNRRKAVQVENATQEPESRPPKRRRLPGNERSGINEDHAALAQSGLVKKGDATHSTGESVESPAAAMKRGRPSRHATQIPKNGLGAEHEGSAAQLARSQAKSNSRLRESRNRTSESKSKPEVPDGPARSKKRGRPPLTEASGMDTENSPEGPSKNATQPKRKRGRPSLTEVSVHETQNHAQQDEEPRLAVEPKRRHGHRSIPAQKGASSAVKEPPQPGETTKTRRKRDRPPGSGITSRAAPAQDREREEVQTSGGDQRRRPRPSAREVDAEEDADLEAHHPEFDAKYQYLVEQSQLVSRAKIAAKWSPLDAASLDAVQSILRDAERPVLGRLHDGRRRHEYAASALTTVSNIILSKLRKGLPFPPPIIGGSGVRAESAAGIALDQLKSGHTDELDYERAVDVGMSLKNRLTPALHSVALLKKEIEREEALLEKEYENLRELETNARTEARGWKDRAKSAHALAPKMGSSGPGGGEQGFWEASKMDLVAPTRPAGGIFERLNEEDDEELFRLAQQIGSHMESMQKNLQQVEGFLPAIMTTRAALHEVLLKHLEPAQVNRVVLG